MRCYGALGQPQLAQRQYQTCIQALHRELGIPASRETTDLYRQIVAGTPGNRPIDIWRNLRFRSP
jgi:DNA-binding SARP family transcriptional activator